MTPAFCSLASNCFSPAAQDLTSGQSGPGLGYQVLGGAFPIAWVQQGVGAACSVGAYGWPSSSNLSAGLEGHRGFQMGKKGARVSHDLLSVAS